MKIEMVRSEDGWWDQRIVCDHCGQPINDLLLGMVIWIDPADYGRENPGDTAEPLVIHKGRCDEERFGEEPRHAPWTELSEVLRRFTVLAQAQQEAVNKAGARGGSVKTKAAH